MENAVNKCHLSPEVRNLQELFLSFANFILVEPERINLIASECDTDEEIEKRLKTAIADDFEFWAKKQDWKIVPNVVVELEQWYLSTDYYKNSDKGESEKGWKLIQEFLKKYGND